MCRVKVAGTCGCWSCRKETVNVKALRVVAVAPLLIVCALAAAQDELPPDVAAKINDEVILTKEVTDRTLRLHGQQELRTLIYYRLVEQEAERQGVVVTAEQVEAEIEKIRKRTGDRFDQYVASLGLTEKLLPDQIRHELYIRELIGKNITVTEQEIEQFYNAEENQARFHQPEKVRFRQIVTETKERAQDALKALKGGADFAEVVKQYSVDEVSRRLGGDIGLDLPKGVLKAEWKPLEDAAFALPLSEVSDPIQVGNKWVIIEVTAKYAAKNVLLEQVHDEIRDEIFKAKLDEKARTWMSDLFSKARKEINRSLWE